MKLPLKARLVDLGMLVTISGLPGVGTTTVGRLLAQGLKLDYRSAGDLFRQQATEAGLSLAEYSGLAETGPGIDRALDELTLKIARQGEMVLEGRLTGWVTLRGGVAAFRVWLSAPLQVRLKRVGLRENQSLEALRERVIAREASERKRYRDYYELDLTDMSPYDLVLEASRDLPEVLVDRIMKAIKIKNSEVVG